MILKNSVGTVLNLRIFFSMIIVIMTLVFIDLVDMLIILVSKLLISLLVLKTIPAKIDKIIDK